MLIPGRKSMMRNQMLTSIAVLAFALAVSAAAQQSALAPAAPATAAPPTADPLDQINPWTTEQTILLRNGQWFDGRRFVRGDRAIRSGRFVDARSVVADASVDLGGGYVVPPMADAHTHLFDGSFGINWQRAQYLREGIFYALTTTAPSSGVRAIRAQLSGPTNVDVASAMGGITGPDSHPAEVYEQLALGLRSEAERIARNEEVRASRRAVDNAYFVVTNAEDFEAKWAIIDRNSPDWIKVFLRDSQLFGQERRGSWAAGGLNPALLPMIAERARAAGRPLVVAASSMADWRAAAAAGARVLSHPPCYQSAQSEGLYRAQPDTNADCRLTARDARAAARVGMHITLISSEWNERRDNTAWAWEAQQLRQMRAHRVPMIVGANAYGASLVDGLVYRATRPGFTNQQLLRLATMDTAPAIFPNRRVGCMDVGCEASMLILADNPLDDLRALRTIRLRIKDGRLLNLPQS
jgi:imidazolonepropionase-like amidohydrolase